MTIGIGPDGTVEPAWIRYGGRVPAVAASPPPATTVLTEWDLNLRGNLRLWPTASPNIEALVAFDGESYDEDSFVQAFPSEAKDPRAVRNTYELLAYAGLAYRASDPSLFQLTELGRYLLSFLGIIGEHQFANADNLSLVALPLARTLGTLVESRAVWLLMRSCHDRLSNEELNRAIARTISLGDIPAVARDIRRGRLSDDPTHIGPRAYDDGKYGTGQETDQRKAMNPQFLLAGGGGILISKVPNDPMRVLRDWAIPLVDRVLASEYESEHASAGAGAVLRRVRLAGVPPDLRS